VSFGFGIIEPLSIKNEDLGETCLVESARCARIGKDWNGSPIPGKTNIGNTHGNVEPAAPYVLSAEKTTWPNVTVTLFRHSRTLQNN
jgi:hypothetical protein